PKRAAPQSLERPVSLTIVAVRAVTIAIARAVRRRRESDPCWGRRRWRPPRGEGFARRPPRWLGAAGGGGRWLTLRWPSAHGGAGWRWRSPGFWRGRAVAEGARGRPPLSRPVAATPAGGDFAG